MYILCRISPGLYLMKLYCYYPEPKTKCNCESASLNAGIRLMLIEESRLNAKFMILRLRIFFKFVTHKPRDFNLIAFLGDNEKYTI